MTFECRKNCGLCCGPVPIKTEIYEKHKDKAADHHLTDIGGHVIALKHHNGAPTAECAFLGEDKKCLIYEDRPALCRIFGCTDALPCPFLEKDGSPRNRRSRRKVERLQDKRLEKFMEG